MKAGGSRPAQPKLPGWIAWEPWVSRPRAANALGCKIAESGAS